MNSQELLVRLQKQSPNKIVVIVVDGLGGLAHPDYDHKSELEYADLPNLDALVRMRGTVLGTHHPIARGFIPGSAAGHLALFGYDPLLPQHHLGRGIFEALDLPLSPGDIVARLNFATMRDGAIVDRRAGRLPDGRSQAEKLTKNVSVEGVRVQFISSVEHRGVLWISESSDALSPKITDTDPGQDGKPIVRSEPREGDLPAAQKTSRIVNDVSQQCLEILENEDKANAVLFRGFSEMPDLDSLADRHGLEPIAIADYPLYRGVARLVGMELAEPVPTLEEKLVQLRAAYAEDYTYYFVHYKAPDARGEDGDFLGKVKSLEAFDAILPGILDVLDLDRDVLLITGDHSTPARAVGHSFHSVPFALHSALNHGYESATAFNEEACIRGTYGWTLAVDLMAALLARADKLKKFDL